MLGFFIAVAVLPTCVTTSLLLRFSFRGYCAGRNSPRLTTVTHPFQRETGVEAINQHSLAIGPRPETKCTAAIDPEALGPRAVRVCVRACVRARPRPGPCLHCSCDANCS